MRAYAVYGQIRRRSCLLSEWFRPSFLVYMYMCIHEYVVGWGRKTRSEAKDLITRLDEPADVWTTPSYEHVHIYMLVITQKEDIKIALLSLTHSFTYTAASSYDIHNSSIHWL